MMALPARYGAARRLVHRGASLFLAAAGWAALLPAVAAAAPAPEARVLIWAYGDSLTAGYGLAPADGFTHQLEGALRSAGVPATVRNGGISGDTIAQGRARLLWGLRGLGARPDLVILELGANDMLRGLPPAQAKANLDLILAELDRRHIQVLVAGMKAPANLGPDYGRAFEAIYPALARRHRARLYPFFLDGVAGRRDLIQADGLHPNARGVAIIVARLLPVVREALSAGSAPALKR